MNTKISFKSTSFLILSVYSLCIAVLFFYAVSKILSIKQFVELLLMWSLIVAPQVILFLYVSFFKIRWAQLASLILQIMAFIFTLYHHGQVLLFMAAEDQPVETLLSVPIWECVIILALGLIMKLVQDY